MTHTHPPLSPPPRLFVSWSLTNRPMIGCRVGGDAGNLLWCCAPTWKDKVLKEMKLCTPMPNSVYLELISHWFNLRFIGLLRLLLSLSTFFAAVDSSFPEFTLLLLHICETEPPLIACLWGALFKFPKFWDSLAILWASRDGGYAPDVIQALATHKPFTLNWLQSIRSTLSSNTERTRSV